MARWPDTEVRLGALMPCQAVEDPSFYIEPNVTIPHCSKEVDGIGYVFGTFDGQRVDYIMTRDVRVISPEGVRYQSTKNEALAAGATVIPAGGGGEIACLPSGWEARLETRADPPVVTSFDLRRGECFDEASHAPSLLRPEIDMTNRMPRPLECSSSDESPGTLTIINETGLPTSVKIDLDDDSECTYCGTLGTVETAPHVVFEKHGCWSRGSHEIEIETASKEDPESFTFEVGFRTNLVITFSHDGVQVVAMNGMPGFW